MLKDDSWLEQELALDESKGQNAGRILRLHQHKISQVQARIAKVQEGFESGIYSLEEARRRVAEYQAVGARAERETARLQREMNAPDVGAADIEAVMQELKALRDRNLEDASFEEKRDVVARLGIRVYPSEDLKSVRIACGLNARFGNGAEPENTVDCRKVLLGTASSSMG